MSWLAKGLKTVLLGALAFALAFAVGRTGVPDSYALALAVSVALCPLLLGFLAARWLKLGPAATLIGIFLLPILVALDARYHLGEPARFDWLLISAAVSAAGWRLGRFATDRHDARKPDMAE
jgi:hypothetical protein